MIENLEILQKNYDQKHFDNFYNRMKIKFEKVYNIILPTRALKEEPKKKEEAQPSKIDTNYEKQSVLIFISYH